MIRIKGTDLGISVRTKFSYINLIKSTVYLLFFFGQSLETFTFFLSKEKESLHFIIIFPILFHSFLGTHVRIKDFKIKKKKKNKEYGDGTRGKIIETSLVYLLLILFLG